MTPMKYVESRDAAYIAGFFDGEGCITTRNYTRAVRCIFTQKHPYVLRWIADTLGYGTVVQRRFDKSPCWELQITRGDDVANLLTTLMPYLRVKRAQAVIAMQIVLTRVAVGRRLPPGVLAQRQSWARELSRLNARNQEV